MHFIRTCVIPFLCVCNIHKDLRLFNLIYVKKEHYLLVDIENDILTLVFSSKG